MISGVVSGGLGGEKILGVEEQTLTNTAMQSIFAEDSTGGLAMFVLRESARPASCGHSPSVPRWPRP